MATGTDLGCCDQPGLKGSLVPGLRWSIKEDGLPEVASPAACLGGSAFHDHQSLLRIAGSGGSLQLQIRTAVSR